MSERYNKEEPKMLHSVVCFIDILGFSSMITTSFNAGKGNELLAKLYNSIKDNIAWFEPISKSTSMKIFTDNIIIGKPIHGDGEWDLGKNFINLADYQLSLTLDGFFIRGGLSVGEYYSDELISFGPALLEAYKIESVEAGMPRIVLSDGVLKYVKCHLSYYGYSKHAPQHQEILVDDDNKWFINYLEAAFIIDEENWIEDAKQLLREHKKIVITKMDEFSNDDKVLKKYNWVAQYHNYFCKDKFVEFEELLINVESTLSFKHIV